MWYFGNRRKATPLLFMVFACTVTCIAQSIDIGGKVITVSARPVPSAGVALVNNGLMTYTDAQGRFSIQGFVTGELPRDDREPQGGFSLINAGGPVYDIRGRLLISPFDHGSPDGNRSNNLRCAPDGVSAVYVIELLTGEAVRMMNIGNRLLRVNRNRAGERTFSKTAQAAGPLDTLVVSRMGYLTRRLAVFSYDTVFDDIELERDHVEYRVDSLMSLMSLAEKIGQMVQAEVHDILGTDAVTRLCLGSVLSGGGLTHTRRPSAWADLSDALQNQARATPRRIPLIYGVDAVHGHNNCIGAVIFPHNIGLGCTRNPALVEQAARVTAMEVAGTGCNWTFAPCIAVPQDERWGRTYEGFGETAELAEMMAGAAVRGYQFPDFSASTTIAACAKHFAADGGTVFGTGPGGGFTIDQGDARCDDATMRDVHLPGYVAAVRAGLATVMCSYSSWNGVDMHAHRYLITDVLKGEMGFDGFVITDYNGVSTIEGTSGHKEQVKLAVNAGVDMFMSPGPDLPAQVIDELTSLHAENAVSAERIDDAARRILRIKFRMGLFENSGADRMLTQKTGSAAHREIARQCVRESVVLLKNHGGILPLAKTAAAAVVVGGSANSLEIQCGGWSVGWGNMTEPTTGTTILEGMRGLAGNLTYSENGAALGGAEVAVVVTGEPPYAEWFGDIGGLMFSSLELSADGKRLIDNCRNAGKKVVLVLVCGRPIILGGYADKCDAIVVVWLPGTEGAGVADVLFGDYAPTGKLSHSWPGSESRIPVNVGDPDYQSDPPLFPYGFGLTYE